MTALKGIRDGKRIEFVLRDMGIMSVPDADGARYDAYVSDFYEGDTLIVRCQTKAHPRRGVANRRLREDLAALKSIGITEVDDA